MPGPVALIGAGEFLPSMAEFDLGLVAATGRTRPRVALLATASYPDGEVTFQRWIAMGLEHFGSLGAEVEAVPVRTREDAFDAGHAQAVGEADLVYLSGGKPRYLLATLWETPVWRAAAGAHARGAILAGCSAGAMVLCGTQAQWRGRLAVWPLRWERALSVVPDAAVIPHYDRLPEALSALMALQAPGGTRVLGIDEDTAVIGRDGSWQVYGRSRVTVWRGRHRSRHRAGEVFRL